MGANGSDKVGISSYLHVSPGYVFMSVWSKILQRLWPMRPPHLRTMMNMGNHRTPLLYVDLKGYLFSASAKLKITNFLLRVHLKFTLATLERAKDLLGHVAMTYKRFVVASLGWEKIGLYMSLFLYKLHDKTIFK